MVYFTSVQSIQCLRNGMNILDGHDLANFCRLNDVFCSPVTRGHHIQATRHRFQHGDRQSFSNAGLKIDLIFNEFRINFRARNFTDQLRVLTKAKLLHEGFDFFTLLTPSLPPDDREAKFNSHLLDELQRAQQGRVIFQK